MIGVYKSNLELYYFVFKEDLLYYKNVIKYV
jgi:hypothetical protein